MILSPQERTLWEGEKKAFSFPPFYSFTYLSYPRGGKWYVAIYNTWLN